MRVVGGMVLGAALMMVALTLVNAHNQNRMALAAERRLAATAIEVQQREIARNLRNFADRREAEANLHIRFNRVWAGQEGNLGAGLRTRLGYDVAFVISPTGETLYASLDGAPSVTTADDAIPEGIGELVAKGVAHSQPAVGLLRMGDRILVAAAAAVGATRMTGLPASERTAVVFAKHLSPSLLERLGRDYLLDGLRLTRPGEGERSSLALLSPSGARIGEIDWDPKRPGTQSLVYILPPVFLAILAFAGFAVLSLRNSRRSARELALSERTVEHYAETLRRSEARFRDIAEASSDWIWECDSDLRLVYVSARFGEATGLPDIAALHRPLSSFFSIDETDQGWEERDRAVKERHSFRDLRVRYRDAAGAVRICRLAARAVFDEKGIFSAYRGTASDITREVEAQARVAHLSLHDPLTDLPNRVRFTQSLNAAFAADRRGQIRLAVLCLDLDFFKEVNDTLGHAAGDHLLREVAMRLRAVTRPSDTVARLGGDEFAIVQRAVNQPFAAQGLARRVVEQLTTPFLVEEHEVQIGTSIGISSVEETVTTPEQLLKNADIALYRAKEAGRNTVRVFEPTMETEQHARRLLVRGRRRTAEREEPALISNA